MKLHSVYRLSLLVTLFVVACMARSANAQAPTPEYEPIDRVENSFVNLATFPVRPMAFDASGNLWAINHHNSTIQKFTGSSAPSTEYALPWGPASVAYWAGPTADPADDEMVVTCRASWAVVELDVASGRILHVHQLRPDATDSSRQGRMAEPGDIVIVGNQALVTCSGADTVLQIDLVTKNFFLYGRDTRPSYPRFLAKAPLFLSVGPDGLVYVAPLISGNNTRVDGGLAGTSVLTPGSNPGMPDVDLFRIDPATHGLTDAAVGMGTILFAHGVNPATGKMWMLNTDAHNAKINGFNDEPSANGRFLDNRVSVFSLMAGGTTPSGSNSPVVLDVVPATTMSGSVGQPFSLTFLNDVTRPEHGDAYICGLLTDNVLVMDKNLARKHEIALPPGSIPRQVLLTPDQSKLLVYCWGTNLVHVYDLNFAAPVVYPSLQLGFDPTPTELVAGRVEFFSARHSRNKNLSCASCHVEGGSDMLAWNLSNQPIDDKGPMVTQTLVGIERLGPFHWRGERSLDAFHGAFPGLLGNSTSTGIPLDLPANSTEFKALKRYIFSLTNPANPNQSRLRILDDQLSTPDAPGASAVLGKKEFFESRSFAGFSHACVNCHQMPTGTGGDVMDCLHAFTRPRRTQEKPAPFHELWRKQASAGNFLFAGTNTEFRSFLGIGFSHVGDDATLSAFVHRVAAPLEPNPLAIIDDITAFIHQADQGLGQAAHYAYLLNNATANPPAGVATPTDELFTYLLRGQALGLVGDTLPKRRNCDVVVFGKVGGSATPRRWYFDRYQSRFVCDDPSLVTPGQPLPGIRTLGDFLAQAAASGSTESNVFLGLPVGMGERFGVDYDLDGTYNAIDGAPLDNTVPGASPATVSFVSAPGLSSPVQVLWTNSRTARLTFDTNVPTKYRITLSPSSSPSTPVSSSDIYSRNHSVLVTDLHASTPLPAPPVTPGSGFVAYPATTVLYRATVEVTPLNGAPLSTTIQLQSGPFKTSKVGENDPRQVRLRLNHIVDGLSMAPIHGSSSSLPARSVSLATMFKRGGQFALTSPFQFTRPPAMDRIVIARVFKRDMVTLRTVPLKRGDIREVPNSDTLFLVDRVFLNQDGAFRLTVGQEIGTAIPDPTGVFLVSQNLSNPNVRMDFELTGTPGGTLGTNEKLIFSIEAVVEIARNRWRGRNDVYQDSTGADAYILKTEIQNLTGVPTWELDNEAWCKWSFPDTTEAGATVSD